MLHTFGPTVVLDALGVGEFDFRPTCERTRLVSGRERRWKAERAFQSPG